jgi:hypothetical protein
MSCLKSTACRISSPPPFVITIAHVPLLPPVVGAACPFPALLSQLAPGKSRAAAAIDGLNRQHPKPRLRAIDKLFWVLALQFWPAWKRCLLIVTPETVVRWHRAGFLLYWNLISKVKTRGRKRISKQVRELIFRMVEENSTWGAPRIHGELLRLGFQISERTVSRWMKRVPRNPDPARRWLAFLRNHREAITSMDFFTVPTFTFGILYCFFVVAHDRRRILHYHVTRYPTHSGSPSNCGKHFPSMRNTSTSSMMAMPSLAARLTRWLHR